MNVLPATLWGLDPLLHVPIQLMIFQVHALIPVPGYEGTFSHHTHPVNQVEIMGVIQSVNRTTKYINYSVDDGTGVLQCIMWIPDQYQMMQNTDSISWLRIVSLGEVVRITGMPCLFRNVMQINFKPGCIEECKDPNAETLFRLQVLSHERDVYTKPLKLPEFIMQEIKNGEATAKMALLDRIRSWVIEHKEFGVLELLDDEENKKVERESEVLGKSKSMMECVVQLEREGLLKCIDRPSMRFRVVENSIVKQDPYGGDIIVLEDDD